MRWNKKKFINNMIDLILGTSCMTLPIIGIMIFNLLTK